MSLTITNQATQWAEKIASSADLGSSNTWAWGGWFRWSGSGAGATDIYYVRESASDGSTYAGCGITSSGVLSIKANGVALGSTVQLTSSVWNYIGLSCTAGVLSLYCNRVGTDGSTMNLVGTTDVGQHIGPIEKVWIGIPSGGANALGAYSHLRFCDGTSFDATTFGNERLSATPVRTGVTWIDNWKLVSSGTGDNGLVLTTSGSPSFAVDEPPLTGSGATTITPSVGSLVLANFSQGFNKVDFQRATLVGALALVGAQPTVTQNAPNTRTPNPGSMAFTQIAPTLLRGTVVSPGTASLTAAGNAPFPLLGASMFRVPNSGSLALTGVAPQTLKVGFGIAPGAGTLTFTGTLPDQTLGVESPVTGALSFAGVAPTVRIGGISIGPLVGSMTLAGAAPTLKFDTSRTGLVGSLALTGGSAPTVTTGAQAVVLPAAAIPLAWTGYAPTVVSGDNAYPAPLKGTITLAGVAPTVDVSVLWQPSTLVGALALTGIAPTIARTTNASISPATGQLNFTFNGPTVNGLAGGASGGGFTKIRRRR